MKIELVTVKLPTAQLNLLKWDICVCGGFGVRMKSC